ncbi:MAG: hypothetical protein AAF328_10160 [Planctomycetota bacterium]
MKHWHVSGIGVGVVLSCLAIAGPVEAALVQITQSGNRVTPLGDFLDADLTGDGVDDVTITSVSFGGGSIYHMTASIEGQGFTVIGGSAAGGNAVVVTGGATIDAPEGTPVSHSHYLPIVFSDAAYGLTDEDGFVEVFLYGDDENEDDTGITIRRLVFDPDQRGTPGFDGKSYPEAVVPEPSTLAAGLLSTVLFRRRR